MPGGTAGTLVDRSSSACPIWCDHHYDGDQPGDLCMHFAPEVETPIGTFTAGLYVNHDGSVYGRLVSLGDDELTPDQARTLAAELVRLSDLLDATA